MFTEPLLDLFSPFGPLGFLILVGLVAFLDAMTFPMLPEMFMIIAYLSYPEGGIVWALALIIS
ncbi:MAG: hypothetical protein KAT70_00765, partial [Thermoplasmata archaeon]|nr:hypothetical protein [Thermoplasmata archaeon]